MRRTFQAVCGVFAITTAVLALSACEEDRPPIVDGPRPTTPPATSAGPGDQGGVGDPGSITQPGTEVAVGETAIVPYQEGIVAITVTSIEPGDQAAFEAEFEDTEGIVPIYIWFTAENVSEQDMSFVTLPRLRAVTEEGIGTGAVLFGDSLGDCQNVSFPDNAAAGTTIESCSLQATPDGVEVAGVQYDSSEGDYTENPITWWR